jgi:hypothetical protein
MLAIKLKILDIQDTLQGFKLVHYHNGESQISVLGEIVLLFNFIGKAVK